MTTTLDPQAGRSGAGATFGKFFLPGPTEVRQEVLQAMTKPMIGHRGKQIEEIMGRIGPRLQLPCSVSSPSSAANTRSSLAPRSSS